MILISLSIYKNVYSHTGSVPLPSHLTSCTPTKSNLYLASSLETVIGEPVLYKLLTFHVPNLISIFHSLGHLSKESVQVRGSFEVFVTSLFFTVKVVSPTPDPQAGGPSLVDCPRLLIQYIRSDLHTWRPFLHPQLEDAPCSGDRDPT
jgi:hypothetical protein